MAETETPTKAIGKREEPEKSPEALQRAAEEAEKAGAPKPGQRAEVTNLDIVRHYFNRAADLLGLADDIRVVFWEPYR
jgi:hypothetical protein